MKVNVVIPSFYPATVYGGPIFSSLYLSLELSKLADNYIHVSTTNTNLNSRLNVPTNIKTPIDNNLDVTYYNETIIGKLSFPLLYNLYRDINASDIVHIQSIFSISTPVALLVSRILGKKVLLTSRGQLGLWCMENGSHFKKLWLKLLIQPFIDNVQWHATSKQEKEEIINFFPRAIVVVIPNGIYTQEFENNNLISRVDFLKKYSIPINEGVGKIIITMGRLQKKKGFDILLRSFLGVLKTYPNSFLLIAGPDEGEQHNLEILIRELQLSSNVYFLGSVYDEDKSEFFASGDLFALPSHNENFGNVYLESLASGTPIIASTQTPWDQVEQYECGRQVDAEPTQFQDAMLDILSKDRDLMRDRSRKLASKYDWSSIAEKFQDVFTNIL